MADSERKKDKKKHKAEAEVEAAQAEVASPEKKKDKKKESKSSETAHAAESPAAAESDDHHGHHKDKKDKKDKKSKKEHKEDESSAQVEETAVPEADSHKKERKESKRSHKNATTDEITPNETAATEPAAKESAKEQPSTDSDSKSSKKKSKEKRDAPAEPISSPAVEEDHHEGDGEAESKSKDKKKHKKKSAESGNGETEENSSKTAESVEVPTASPGKAKSSKDSKDASEAAPEAKEEKKERKSKKGKEKEPEDEEAAAAAETSAPQSPAANSEASGATGEDNIDLSNFRSDQEKTVEELLDEGWVMAPTERPKPRPEKPLPRVPGQAIAGDGAGVWASMTRPDFKALGLLPQDDEPAAEPVEEEVPADPVVDFGSAPVSEKYTVGAEVSRQGTTRTHAAKSKVDDKDVLVVVSSKIFTPVYNQEHAKSAQAVIAALKEAPHVETYLDSYVDKQSAFFVVPKHQGDLPTIIKKDLASIWSEKHACQVVKQMLLAVGAMHSKHILHRDATAFNLFVRYHDNAGAIEVVLGNFLQALEIDPKSLPTDEPNCSDLYKSPEIASGEPYSFPSDMWALGCTAFFLLCGHAPFSAEKNRVKRRMSIKSAALQMVESEWKDVSAEARDFIKKVLTAKPSDRLTATQALQHPWIEHGGSANLLPLVASNLTL